MPFHCSICGEESTRICAWCTKDTCSNHLCGKCGRCSDCCECEVPLEEPVHPAAMAPEAAPIHESEAALAEDPPPADALEPAALEPAALPETAAVPQPAPPPEHAPAENASTDPDPVS